MPEIREPSTSLATDWLDYLTGQLSRESVLAHLRRAGKESGLKAWQIRLASILSGLWVVIASAAILLQDKVGNWIIPIQALNLLVFLWAYLFMYSRPLRSSLHRSIAEWSQTGLSQTLTPEDQRRLQSHFASPRSYWPAFGTIIVWVGNINRVLLISIPLVFTYTLKLAPVSALLEACLFPFLVLFVILTQFISVSSTAGTARERLETGKCVACGFSNESPHIRICPECGIGVPTSPPR